MTNNDDNSELIASLPERERERVMDGDVGDRRIEDFGEASIVSLDELNPDFTDDPGASSAMTAAEEGEPWFPPTDPVIEPESNVDGGASIAGTIDYGDDEDFTQAEDLGNPSLADDELTAQVEAALQSDAQTHALEIHVLTANRVVTLRGAVRNLDDAEAAEAVAGQVQGVAEVREELTVEAVETER